MIIGLTGGIGAGKTLVSNHLRQLGAGVIDADAVARDVVRPGEAAYRDIVRRFGPEVLTSPGGELDRRALADKVFGDIGARRDLEAITHPRISERMKVLTREFLTRHPGGVAVLDVPLLIETGIQHQVDQVWVVTAGYEQRVERVVRRDGVVAADVKRRMAAQATDQERLAHADVVIDNSGTAAETLAQVDRQWQLLDKRNHAETNR